MKLKIIDKKIFIDDKEIKDVTKISIHKEYKMPDRIVLEFYVDEVEESLNESNNKQNSNTTVNINGSVIAEKVVKELSEKLNETNKPIGLF
ncbi:hypothetical protein [Clostridium sp. VAP51]|uniref:hypothetical protein n=1 Tax=Clostridium sp. VAP51 TaxID=2949978 RepID=UPI002079527D|nr:hypothetical protein [Clostridium sp. VAP51]